jgi:hypothetical protein
MDFYIDPTQVSSYNTAVGSVIQNSGGTFVLIMTRRAQMKELQTCRGFFSRVRHPYP